MRSKYLLWLGVGLLGTSLLTGCRNARHRHSTCDCVMQPCCNVVVAPPAQPEAVNPVVHTLPPAKKDNVQLTAVAPGASQSGGIAGTIELTAAEAEAMGIKPGYTPGALYVASSNNANPPIVNAEPKSTEPPVVEERRSEPTPVIPAAVEEKASEPAMPATVPAVEQKQEEPVLEIPAVIEKRSDSQE